MPSRILSSGKSAYFTSPQCKKILNAEHIRIHLIESNLITPQGRIIPLPDKSRSPKQRKKIIPMIRRSIDQDENDFESQRPRRALSASTSRFQRSDEETSRKAKHLDRSFDATTTRKRDETKTTAITRHSKSNHAINRAIISFKRDVTPKILSETHRVWITFQYYKPETSVQYDRLWFEPAGDEVVITQQHCGGENLIVFKGFVQYDGFFSFESRRHPTYPLALAFYINGVVKNRLSICCEWRAQDMRRIGGSKGLFSFIKVENSHPCRRCRFQAHLKAFDEKSNGTSSNDQTQESEPVLIEQTNSRTEPRTHEISVSRVSPSPNSKSSKEGSTKKKASPTTAHENEYSDEFEAETSLSDDFGPKKNPPAPQILSPVTLIHPDKHDRVKSPAGSTASMEKKSPSPQTRSSPSTQKGPTGSVKSPESSETEDEKRKTPPKPLNRSSPIVQTTVIKPIETPQSSETDDKKPSTTSNVPYSKSPNGVKTDSPPVSQRKGSLTPSARSDVLVPFNQPPDSNRSDNSSSPPKPNKTTKNEDDIASWLGERTVSPASSTGSERLIKNMPSEPLLLRKKSPSPKNTAGIEKDNSSLSSARSKSPDFVQNKLRSTRPKSAKRPRRSPNISDQSGLSTPELNGDSIIKNNQSTAKPMSSPDLIRTKADSSSPKGPRQNKEDNDSFNQSNSTISTIPESSNKDRGLGTVENKLKSHAAPIITSDSESASIRNSDSSGDDTPVPTLTDGQTKKRHSSNDDFFG